MADHAARRGLVMWGMCVALVLGLMLAGPGYTAVPASPTEERLLTDAKFLASDDLEGRGVGSAGLDKAAEYIRDQFAKAGLNVSAVNGGAFQTFALTVGSKLGAVNGLTFTGPVGKSLSPKSGEDFQTMSFGGSGKLDAELVFAGYGIDAEDKQYNDYAGLDVKGKVVVIMRRAPQQGKPGSAFAGEHGGISRYADLQSKVSTAAARGAAGILLVNDPYSLKKDADDAQKQVAKYAEGVALAAEEFDGVDPQNSEKLLEARKKLSLEVARYRAAKGEMARGQQDPLMKFGYGGDESYRSIPVAHISQKLVNEVLEGAGVPKLAELEAQIDSDFKPRSQVLAGWKVSGELTVERTQKDVRNVIGVVEAAEGPLAGETVVIGAHYDHVGRGGKGSLAPGSTEIHNGADDNASGTTVLLEVARRLAARKDKLPRRVVLIAFTGEELGLLGSARYTKEPVFPLASTVAMLNMDMVGRLVDDKLTVFGTGTSPVWKDQLERHGKDQGLQIISKPEGFGPSDHSSFYAQKIPVLHFFTGNHNDYHRPSDDWDKLNLSGMDRVATLVERIAVEVATNPERPAYVAVQGTGNIMRDGNRPYFGSIPDFSSEQPGYALGGVAPGSPAEKGGLKAGDRIVQLGAAKIENLNDFDLGLRRYAAGDSIDVTVMRGSEKVVVKVTLGKPRG